MNDNVIYVNLGGHEKDGRMISCQTIHLWTSTMAANRWMLTAPKPNQSIVHKGVGMSVVYNLAIAVEGFIGYMIFALLDTNEAVQHPLIEKLEKVAWDKKVKMHNELFAKPLESYHNFPAMDILLLLRNNLLHGLSYKEYNEALSDDGNLRSNIKSDNEKYEKARQYFINQKLLADTSQMSNSESLWKNGDTSPSLFRSKFIYQFCDLYQHR
jgi:hypothetical protein